MKNHKIMHLLLLIVVLGVACNRDEKEPAQKAVTEEMQLAQPQQADSVAHVQKKTIVEPVKKQQKHEEKNISDYTIYFTPDGRYTLQLSSWKTRTYAERDKLRFFDAGFDCRIDEVVLPQTGEKWYRVRIGRFRTLQAAREFADKYINELLEEPAWIDYR